MDELNHTPTQETPETGEGLSFTITGEDAEAQAALHEKKPEKKKSPLPWILAGAAAALIVAIVLVTGKPASETPEAPSDDPTISEDTDQPGAQEDPANTDEQPETPDDTQTEPAGNGVSYTVEADALTEDVLDRTVAVCGDDRLTNRDLPYYYWQQYYSFANNYGSYAAYFIDQTVPFDQQMCVFDDSLTWQQYFLQAAIQNYQSVSAVWQEARLAGFRLDEEDQTYLDELGSNLTTSAVTYGFESADAYLQTAYGPSASLSAFRAFVERQLIASAYLQSCVDAKEYSSDDVSAYFDENAANYTANGIEKSDTNMVNVRHILIKPSGQNDDGTYTDAAWAEAKQKAEELLAQWQAGEHTEDSFAYLAAENSQDPGSATNGGLYEEVYPGQMVDTFDAWCFDPARQPGDTGIVKTDYGYHIMYFSSQCEHPYWYVCAEADYLDKLSVDVLTELTDKFESSDEMQNAALVDIMQTTAATE